MSEPRRVFDASGQQVGEQDNQAAGRDINQFDPRALATLLQFLEGDRASRDAFSAMLERLGERVEHISNQLRAHELMQERRDKVDGEERERRRQSLDESLSAIHARVQAAEHQAAATRRHTTLLVCLSLLALVVAIVGLL